MSDGEAEDPSATINAMLNEFSQDIPQRCVIPFGKGAALGTITKVLGATSKPVIDGG